MRPPHTFNRRHYHNPSELWGDLRRVEADGRFAAWVVAEQGVVSSRL